MLEGERARRTRPEDLELIDALGAATASSMPQR
jgi:hypothetical protein